MYFPMAAALTFALQSWHNARPAFFMKPWSAKVSWHISHLKQLGCQLLFMALMTRPMMNSLHKPQQGANSTWKSCSQYFLPSNWKWITSFTNPISFTSKHQTPRFQMHSYLVKYSIRKRPKTLHTSESNYITIKILYSLNNWAMEYRWTRRSFQYNLWTF